MDHDWYHNHGWKFNGDRYVSPSEVALGTYYGELTHYLSLPWWRRLVTRKPNLKPVEEYLPHD